MSVDQITLVQRIKESLEEIFGFVSTPQFQSVLNDIRLLEADERASFVESILLNRNKLKERGIHIPSGTSIQRSYFLDNRPTLFCVSQRIDDVTAWHKVTITYDNEGEWLQ